MVISSPAEAVQIKSGKNSMERRMCEYTKGSGGMLPREILKFSFSKMHI